jgi:hypothetical protein
MQAPVKSPSIREMAVLIFCPVNKDGARGRLSLAPKQATGERRIRENMIAVIHIYAGAGEGNCALPHFLTATF